VKGLGVKELQPDCQLLQKTSVKSLSLNQSLKCTEEGISNNNTEPKVIFQLILSTEQN